MILIKFFIFMRTVEDACPYIGANFILRFLRDYSAKQKFICEKLNAVAPIFSKRILDLQTKLWYSNCDGRYDLQGLLLQQDIQKS